MFYNIVRFLCHLFHNLSKLPRICVLHCSDMQPNQHLIANNSILIDTRAHLWRPKGLQFVEEHESKIQRLFFSLLSTCSDYVLWFDIYFYFCHIHGVILCDELIKLYSLNYLCANSDSMFIRIVTISTWTDFPCEV